MRVSYHLACKDTIMGEGGVCLHRSDLFVSLMKTKVVLSKALYVRYFDIQFSLSDVIAIFKYCLKTVA